MKRTLIVAATLLVSIAFTVSPAPAQVSFSISFGDFYSSLGPYGDWVYVDYGVYAWRPGRIVHGWMPYTYGRWVWSAYGWYWVSDEPWSWAVYHYGRWYYDDYYGWIWVPGYDWAPAWVEWRYGPDYVGWAPLGPYALFSAQGSVYYSQAYRAPYQHWTFVAHGSMTRPNVYRYRYQGDDIRRVYGASRYTGSVRYRDGVAESRGPDREYVERRGRIRIGTADVVDVKDYSRERATRQGERERIEVYRPQVKRDEAEQSMRPDRVTRSEHAPSIDSRYLDQRMRPDVRDDDRMRERMGREKSDVRGPDGLQRPMPDGRPQVQQQPSARPAVKEPPRQREARPEAPKEAQRPEPKPRDRD
jgi:hypothetical protein